MEMNQTMFVCVRVVPNSKKIGSGARSVTDRYGYEKRALFIEVPTAQNPLNYVECPYSPAVTVDVDSYRLAPEGF